MSEDPYKPPQVEAELGERILSPEEAAAIRTPRLTHEVIVRTIAVLFFMKAVGILSQPSFVDLFKDGDTGGPIKGLLIIQWIGLAIICGLKGWGLWKFNPWAWVSSTMLLVAAIMYSEDAPYLIPFHAVILLSLLLPKTRTLSSDHHRCALRHSPRMKYGVKRIAPVAGMLILLMILCGLMMEVYQARVSPIDLPPPMPGNR